MAITQSITVLPTPPSRADPDNFDSRADAFLSALPTMQTQMNTWAGQANTTAAEIGIVSEGLLSVTPGANKVPQADGDGELAIGWLDLTGYAPAANGVTNGDSHDHSGGDGAQIAYANLSGQPTLGTAAAAATSDFAAASHAHGNLTSAGAIGSTANLPVITTTSGALTVGAFGTEATNFCAGNDARLSDARTPASHTTGSHSDWPAGVSMTEVGYLDGVTSGIQSQLNAKGNGKILQVVYGSTTTEVTNSTVTYADTGITATITPSATSSKVLVMVVLPIRCVFADPAKAATKLLRGATSISEKVDHPYSNASEIGSDTNHHVLDSPATTNATTYKVQFRKGSTDAGDVVAMVDSNPGTIVLMEVAA